MPQPFLVSNYKTGIDLGLEPWLTPNDAFVSLRDGFVYRGVLQPRNGLQQFATGGIASNDRQQSKIYKVITNEDIADTGTASGTLANTPVQPGSTSWSDGGAQTATDNSQGVISGGGGTTGTINYITGAYSITWGAAVGGDAVVSYNTPDDQCVMGLYSYWKNDFSRDLIAFSQDSANKYNTTNNEFQPLTFSAALQATIGGTAFTGNDKQYFHAAMYFSSNGTPRLIATNNQDAIVFYDGSTVKQYTNAATDNTDYVAPTSGALTKAQWVFSIQNRLIFVAPTIGGTTLPRTYIFSRLRNNAGDGDDFAGEGAGEETLPTNSTIRSCVQLKDSLIMFTNDEVWEVQFVNDIDIPVTARRIDRGLLAGAEAPFSGVQFLGQATAVGGLGIIGTDGRDGFRVDNKIPDYIRDNLDRSLITTTFGGTIREQSQYWWNFAYKDDDPSHNTRTLVYNYEEGNWCEYRHPLSAIGDFELSSGTTWGNIDGDFKNAYAAWGTTDAIWGDLDNTKTPVSLVGDCDGFVYQASTGESDQSFEITGATSANPCVLTTEPHNIVVGDRLLVDNITGLTLDGTSVINGEIVTVTAVTATTITIGLDTSEADTAYTSGGSVQKVYTFEAKTKPLNPFVSQGKRARLGKIGFYVDAETRDFTVELSKDRRDDPYQTNRVVTTDSGDNQKKRWVYIRVNESGNFHSMKIKQDSIDKGRVHAFLFFFDPAGRLEY